MTKIYVDAGLADPPAPDTGQLSYGRWLHISASTDPFHIDSVKINKIETINEI